MGRCSLLGVGLLRYEVRFDLLLLEILITEPILHFGCGVDVPEFAPDVAVAGGERRIVPCRVNEHFDEAVTAGDLLDLVGDLVLELGEVGLVAVVHFALLEHVQQKHAGRREGDRVLGDHV